MDGEARFFEEAAVDGCGGIEGGCCGFGVNAEGSEGGLEGGADGGNVALASHLGDEAASGTQSSADVGEGGLLAGDSGDPVESGVGEDGVELIFVGEVGGAVVVYNKAARVI
ncbi:MAG: hypothetical protein JWP98_918 [Edaphobacter sp.]|nr:hypothetical protein [Edaphobacter sp.]